MLRALSLSTHVYERNNSMPHGQIKKHALKKKGTDTQVAFHTNTPAPWPLLDVCWAFVPYYGVSQYPTAGLPPLFPSQRPWSQSWSPCPLTHCTATRAKTWQQLCQRVTPKAMATYWHGRFYNFLIHILQLLLTHSLIPTHKHKYSPYTLKPTNSSTLYLHGHLVVSALQESCQVSQSTVLLQQSVVHIDDLRLAIVLTCCQWRSR